MIHTLRRKKVYLVSVILYYQQLYCICNYCTPKLIVILQLAMINETNFVEKRGKNFLKKGLHNTIINLMCSKIGTYLKMTGYEL